MKTIKEQIEIMQHFENGGEVKRVHLVGDHSDLKIFSKDKHSHICFNWNDYDYEIHKEVKPLFLLPSLDTQRSMLVAGCSIFHSPAP